MPISSRAQKSSSGINPLAARILIAGFSLVLAACTSVPFDYPKTPSEASPPDPNSPMGAANLAWQDEHDEMSGFIGLSNGMDAMGARLRMMATAKHSIDAQYFILKNDRAGALFVGKMLLAADRGVQVRLLIDDVFTSGIDRQMSLLDSHPNIEVRIFNPVSRNSLKYWAYLLDFGRTNRRMHNKSFTVDNSMSIVGGRNIGEEYFELKQDVMFDDFEVLVIGPVVPEVSAGFDEFWNSQLSVPVEAFNVKVDPAELDQWRQYMRERVVESETGIYAQAVNSTFLKDIREKRIEPAEARATVVTDSPEKLLHKPGDLDLATLALEKRQRFLEAEREIVIFTPYYIPKEGGVEFVRERVEKGVRVVIVTNSLASTNHVAVHGHYAKYRKRLIEAGAELYEIRSVIDVDETGWGHTPERVTLHSKATIIDRDTIFVGSLNFDPRSIFLNTEMGIFIESAEVGEEFTRQVMEVLPEVTYLVDLDEKGSLRWTYAYGDEYEVWHKEPQTQWGRRFKAGIYRILPLENQL
jgi:putative cardiolipin synthase